MNRHSRRVAVAALALGWRAAPVASALSLALTLITGLLPAATSWTGKLLFDELARGWGLDAGRASMLIVVGAALASFGALLTVVGSQVARRVQRSVSLRAQTLLYGRVNALPGIKYFEDPEFQDHLRLAEQGAQSAPAVCQQDADRHRQERREHRRLSRGPDSALAAGGRGRGRRGRPGVSRAAHAGPSPGGNGQAMVETNRRRFFFQQLLTEATAAKEVRLFGLGPLFQGRYLAMLRKSADADLAVEAYGSRVSAAIALLNAVVSVGAGVVMVRAAASGRVTVGGFMLFTTAVAGIQGALAATIGQASEAGRNLRLFGSFLAVLDMPQDIRTGSLSAPRLREGIQFRDVWFRYHDGGPWVLQGVTLDIPQGSSVGLVGLNGAGKSTLVKLLCRFYEPERGQILWDGVDVAELSIEGLRARIGVTFQDFCHYDATAAENIGLGDVDRIDDRLAISQAAQTAGVDKTLAGLRDGYDTFLSRVFRDADSERGTALSGGQWQRVALARSLMRQDADLLILDEPSAGLDPEAEHEVHQALVRRRAGHTSLLISHRLSTLRDADTIVVLDRGRITERGTHEELMAGDTNYAHLFLTQAAGYRDRPVGSPA